VVCARDHLSRVTGKRPPGGWRHPSSRWLDPPISGWALSGSGSLHASDDDESGPDGGEDPQVGDQTREQRAGGEPGIAPEPLDTDRSGRQIGWATSPIAASRVIAVPSPSSPTATVHGP
jgi:hypothetical protein